MGTEIKELRSKDVYEQYIERLETDAYISFKSFCEEKNVNYRKSLDWTRRRSTSIRDLQNQAQGLTPTTNSSSSFIQFKPSPYSSNVESRLTGVNITFPDGVNLVLQECSPESLITLLSNYRPLKIDTSCSN